jgi:hypothetical protein
MPYRACLFTPPRGVTSLARAGPRRPPQRHSPCVFRSPTLFSACSRHTGSLAFVWCVCRPLGLFSAIAHSISSIMGLLSVFTFVVAVSRPVIRHCSDSAGALPAQPPGPPCRGSEPFLLPDISRLSTHTMLRLSPGKTGSAVDAPHWSSPYWAHHHQPANGTYDLGPITRPRTVRCCFSSV